MLFYYFNLCKRIDEFYSHILFLSFVSSINVIYKSNVLKKLQRPNGINIDKPWIPWLVVIDVSGLKPIY